jgi:hypothetical protein
MTINLRWRQSETHQALSDLRQFHPPGPAKMAAFGRFALGVGFLGAGRGPPRRWEATRLLSLCVVFKRAGRRTSLVQLGGIAPASLSRDFRHCSQAAALVVSTGLLITAKCCLSLGSTPRA